MIIDKYNYFLFDIDRTIWDFDANASVAMCAVLDKFQLPIGNRELFLERYEVINHRLWDDYEAGRVTKEYLRRERFHQTFKNYYNIDNIELSERIGHEYLDFMALGKILMPGTREVLDAIMQKGGKMAIVSNGFKEVQYRKLKISEIEQYFSAVMVSEEVGVHKPHPAIFSKAMDSIGGTKRETLMVGDDFTNDIEGAQIFGIDQFYYNPKHIPCDGAPTYESDNLADLIK
ncbi:MAG: YjjG family noncanonical pyrimidine nucleotidase [Bacteroidales bacterium]|nr:YjjG family noncanonical pyrimidine nucleotidase [Bacteroidales bacterium]MDD4670502.1 YjjG family noncanonical pyrimidine nucleotidase [Bacteroidales bacterium]